MSNMRSAAPYLISVIIPAYNYAHTLERAVRSVYAQLTPACELIIINDGSTDDTRALLATFDQQYPAAVVVHQENSGLAATRNAGIRISQGDYLVFLDADDALMPGAIQHILQCIQETHASFIIGGHTSVEPSGRRKQHLPTPLPATPAARLKAYLIDKTVSFSNGGCAIHREIFNHIRYPEAFRNAEDIPVFAYLMANASCAQVDVALVEVYKHADSLRHAFQHTLKVGTAIVDEVFDPARMPAHCQYLKKPFMVQRLLSLSRSAFEAGHYAQTKAFYYQALQLSLAVVWKWSYTKKVIMAWFKTHKWPVSA